MEGGNFHLFWDNFAKCFALLLGVPVLIQKSPLAGGFLIPLFRVPHDLDDKDNCDFLLLHSDACFSVLVKYDFWVYTWAGAMERILDHCVFLSSAPTTPADMMALASLQESTQPLSPSTATSPHGLCRESNTRVRNSLFSRVPMGSPFLLMRTQALSSKRTTLPSGRCSFLAVRTTTACRMSPRRTLLAALTDTLPPPDSGPKLRCFCTTTMMRSPGRVD